MTSDDRALVDYLAGRDVACPACGYNVRDLASGACPECGLELRLEVALAEPCLAAWTTGLIGLAAGLGFAVPMLGLVLQSVVRFGANPTTRQLLAALGSDVVLGGAWLAAWVWHRAWVRRRPALVRWTLGVLCWSVFVVPVLAMLVLAYL